MPSEGLTQMTERDAAESGSARRKAWAGFGVLGLMVAGHAALETARTEIAYFFRTLEVVARE